MSNNLSKRLFCILLCALTLISVFTSCGKDTSSENNDQTSQISGSDENSSDTTGETQSEEKLGLPDMDFNGEEVMFLTEKNGGFDWYTSKEIYAEEQTGELFNDTVYNRNLKIEDKYNIKIAETNKVDANKVAKKSLTAGDTEYDVIMPYMNNNIALASEGMLYNLKNLKYMDLERSWWDQRANDNLTISDKLFMTTGDISILDNECTMVMFFNKNMITDYSLENPYELVNSGKWTLDKLTEMSVAVTKDIDGDGKMTNDDRWGLSVANNAPISFYFASGERIAKPNDDGVYELTMDNERGEAVISKIMEMSANKQLLTSHTGNSNFDVVSPAFNDGRIMFVTFALVDINALRDAQFEFGILPYPKYDETQEDYNNLISTGIVSSVSVPFNCTKLDTVGFLLEALAYYSVDTLTVAYYDNALKTRYIRDDESGDMLDIIFRTRVYDLGFIFDWGGIGSLVSNMAASSSPNFKSSYAKIEEKAKAKMQETIDTFSQIG